MWGNPVNVPLVAGEGELKSDQEEPAHSSRARRHSRARQRASPTMATAMPAPAAMYAPAPAAMPAPAAPVPSAVSNPDQYMSNERMAFLQDAAARLAMQKANVKFQTPSLAGIESADNLHELLVSMLGGLSYVPQIEGTVQPAVYTPSVWLQSRQDMLNGLCYLTRAAINLHDEQRPAQQHHKIVIMCENICMKTSKIMTSVARLQDAMREEKLMQKKKKNITGFKTSIKYIFAVGVRKLQTTLPNVMQRISGIVPRVADAWLQLENSLDEYRSYFNSIREELLENVRLLYKHESQPNGGVIAKLPLANNAQLQQEWPTTQRMLSEDLEAHDQPAKWPAFLRSIVQWVMWSQAVAQFQTMGIEGIKATEEQRGENDESLEEFLRVRAIKGSSEASLRRQMEVYSKEIMAQTPEEVKAIQRKYRETLMQQLGVGHGIPVKIHNSKNRKVVTRIIPWGPYPGSTPEQLQASIGANRLLRQADAERNTALTGKRRAADINRALGKRLREGAQEQLGEHTRGLRESARRRLNPTTVLRKFLNQQITMHEKDAAGGGKKIALWHVIFSQQAQRGLRATLDRLLQPGANVIINQPLSILRSDWNAVEESLVHFYHSIASSVLNNSNFTFVLNVNGVPTPMELTGRQSADLLRKMNQIQLLRMVSGDRARQIPAQAPAPAQTVQTQSGEHKSGGIERSGGRKKHTRKHAGKRKKRTKRAKRAVTRATRYRRPNKRAPKNKKTRRATTK